jgi:DNA primase large subunit
MSAAAVIEIAPARRAREKNKKELQTAADLEQRLIWLRDEFGSPALREILQAAIDAAHRVATSSRKRDRDDVFDALDVRGCRTVEEVCEETRLTAKTVRRILEEFVSTGMVYERDSDDPESDGGRPEKEYWPYTTRADSPFKLLNRK